MNTTITLLVFVAGLLFFYHHFIYPWLLKRLAALRLHPTPATATTVAEPAFIRVVMPCYNEEKYLADKLFNFAFLDYPRDRFQVILANDGSTDDTLAVYHRTIAHPLLAGVQFELRDFAQNRGKVAVVNQLLNDMAPGLVCLSDVSALISIDALTLINQHMQDPEVGVVAASYGLLNPGSAGEAAYWQYQVAIKQYESAMGSTLGVHGALYCLRAELFKTLPKDCINDDFVIPMQIIEQGYRVIYDANIIGVELEQSSQSLDFHRRIRIAAGNVQQVVQLKQLLHPRFGATAFNFFSGKCLRVLMPLCLLMMLSGAALLALNSGFWLAILLLQLLCYAGAAWVQLTQPRPAPTVLRLIHYLVSGHLANLLGWCQLARRSQSVLRWRKTTTSTRPSTFMPRGTQWGKRLFDVVIALTILLITLPLWALIALAIRLDSPGPVFFRQLRIGLADEQKTDLFYMIKFRSMVQDAEKTTGAVWAGKNDSRVTRVGHFLRKTRLDELPQMLNVLCGDMSLVGPRPERPELCSGLETQIPFFVERTHFVRPGITGLAQVNLGYDSCLDDVRQKLLYDHSYALALHTLTGWLRMDLFVLCRTFWIMVSGRGQ